MTGGRVRLIVLLAALLAAVVWRFGAAAAPPPWSESEAMVFDRLRRIDQLRRVGADPWQVQPELALSHWVEGYVAHRHHWREGAWSDAESAAQADAPWVVYCHPIGEGAAQRRVFCLASSGALLILPAPHGYADAAPPADAACDEAGRGRPEDLRAVTGRGRDRQRWQSADSVRTQKVAVTLTAEGGRSIDGFAVYLLPAARVRERVWGPDGEAMATLDGGAPLGKVELDGGKGAIEGPPMASVGVCLARGDEFLRVPPEAVQWNGSELRVHVRRGPFVQFDINHNESAVIGRLKQISSAQAQLQAAAVIDVDHDGAGEYGFLAELAGAVAVRSDAAGHAAGPRLAPAVLAAGCGEVQRGRVERDGYLLQMYLPDADGRPVAEAADGGGAGQAVDPQQAERCWIVYAWPVECGVTGLRAFCITHGGDVFSTRNEPCYSGHNKPPPFSAAFRQGGSGRLTDVVAANALGGDGQLWSIVQ